MSKTSTVSALFLALLLTGSGMARAQDSCQLARQPVLIDGHQRLVFQLGGISSDGLSLHLSVQDDGRTGGIARITDGTSNTILLAEQHPALRCEDVNLDGFAGLTHLVFALSDVPTGSVVTLVLVPLDGEVDSGLEQMSIALPGRTFVETVDVSSGASLGIGPRLAYRFAVTASAGRVDLGSWSKVSGLNFTVDVIDYRPGGGTITLQRAASSESLLVRAWLDELAQTFERPTLEIALLDVSGEPIATWTFHDTFPIKWEISGSDANQSGFAIETLVIEYEDVVVDRR